MSNALPSWQYLNPEEVLERKQESERKRSCAGCKHSYAVEFATGVHNGCGKGKLWGERCILYQETK